MKLITMRLRADTVDMVARACRWIGQGSVALYGWLVTRSVVLLLLLWHKERGFGDVDYFHEGANALMRDPGSLESTLREYPSGGVAILVAIEAAVPDALHRVGFLLVMLGVDLLVLLLLVHQGRRYGSMVGALLWLVGLPLLGTIPWLHFDLVAAGLAIAGLAAASRKPGTAGTLLGLGGAVKLWPLALFAPVVLGYRRLARTVIPAAIVLGLVLALTATVGGAARITSPLGFQRHRGLEVESLIALPWLWARQLGASAVNVELRDRTFEVVGPGISTAVGASTSLVILALVGWVTVAILAIRRNATDPTGLVLRLSVILVGLALLTNKVLSPQFLTWWLAVLCIALSRPDRALARAVAPTVAALLLTHAELLIFGGLVGSPSLVKGWIALPLLTCRDGFLLAAVALSITATLSTRNAKAR